MNNLKKTIISCFVLFDCFIGAKADVEINETTFPDEEFRNWVLRQSYGVDGVLTEEETANVTRIMVVGGRDIQSLKGIEYFTALTYLNCASNHLTALDVSKCTKLEVLYCDWNQLTSLDVSKNTALKDLACGKDVRGGTLGDVIFDGNSDYTFETKGTFRLTKGVRVNLGAQLKVIPSEINY